MRDSIVLSLLVLSLLVLSPLGLNASSANGAGDTAVQRAESPAALVRRLVEADAAARPAIFRELRELGPSAAEATRAAAEELDDAALRSRVEAAADWMLAEELFTALESGLESQLTYDGQYRDLKKYERAGVRTLLRIIDDTATSYPLRLAACRAIADVAGESVLPELRSLHDDILLPPPLREQIGILLAIYGDTRAVDKQLRDLERYARRPDLSIRIAAITELSHLYYRVRDYARAVEYYDEILAAYEDFAKRATIPELQESINDQLTLHYYNAACSNSLKGDVARAQELLRKAIKRDPMHLDNIELDGDLRNVREDPSYAAFRKALGELFEGEDL